MECRANLQIGFNFVFDGIYYAWHQLLHWCLLQTSNSTYLSFELWEGSCTGSLNNIPVDLADMFEDEVRTPLPLPLDKPLENKALQGFF